MWGGKDRGFWGKPALPIWQEEELGSENLMEIFLGLYYLVFL
jgi:hypothetical protein